MNTLEAPSPREQADLLAITRDDDIEIWELNDPLRHNPISSSQMVNALLSAIDQAARLDGPRAIVLTGAGKSFSSGGDVAAMQERSGQFAGSTAEQRAGYQRGIQRLPRAFQELDVPTIAAVNGSAIGAGLDLALMCDMRIAATNARFAESFVKLGLVPGDGGAWLLQRTIGWARAAEMTLTGDPIDATTASAWGLVSRVVEPDDLLTQARDLARRIALNPSTAVRMSKRLMRESQRAELGSSLELAAAFQAIAHTTPEHTQAVNAFLRRREAKQ